MMRAEFQILEEDLDENYEPTRDEILEYATYLGMSPRSDTKYFHIAREGLKTPLPTPWKPAELKNGELVYYNPATKVLQEDHPLDEYFRRKYIEEKKKDAQSSQPSKTSKKLKGLCEQLREPPTQDTTQKTEKKQQPISEVNFSNPSQLNESFLQQEQDKLDVQFKFELDQYEKEQESFLLLYKMNRQKRFEEEKQEIEQKSSDESDREENFPEKALKIRQRYLNKKEQAQQEITQQIENRYQLLKSQINEESNNKIQEYKAAKQIKQEQRVIQLKNDWESKLTNFRERISSAQQELETKKISFNKQLQLQKQTLINKWQKQQAQFEKELQQTFQQELKNLEYQYKQKQNELYEKLKQRKMQQQQEIRNQYANTTELQVRKRWREVYKEKLELQRVNLEHDLECELKVEELKFREEMTNNIYKYKNMLRANLVKLQQQQFENERSYLTNYYNEQLQAIKGECSKRNELEIQKLELSQMVMSNESFTQLEKQQPKPQFNPDLRIKRKELELQIKELQSSINELKMHKASLLAAQQEAAFFTKVINSNNKIDFLKESIQKQDEILEEIKKKVIHQPQIEDTFNEIKNVRKDQWEFQIDQEMQWLTLQKERLKFDKQRMHKVYEKLNTRQSPNQLIETYNKCVNTIRSNQQILKNCEYIVNKLEQNQKQYKQTKIIQYLKENDTLIEDLNLQKSLLEGVPQIPIEVDHYFSNYKFGNQTDYSNLLQQTCTQKQLLRDIRDNLNKSMQSRLG